MNHPTFIPWVAESSTLHENVELFVIQFKLEHPSILPFERASHLNGVFDQHLFQVLRKISS
ncbi:MAG TPA: hypothetical protein VJ063_06955 [Verrucomicrobiae bacterium]|nr:hypothetical protein [Verrucomicrobiae bacterium]